MKIEKTQDNLDEIINNITKLQWACRRGMLELDVLLRNFLDERYASLSIEQKKSFIELLSCTDVELFAWLMGHETAPSLYISTVEMIRHHARTRFQT